MNKQIITGSAFILIVALLVQTGCGTTQTGTETAQGKKAGQSVGLDAALAWIATHQEADGHWDSEKYVGQKPNHAVTSLAILAFLYSGNTTRDGKYVENVRKGVQWLIKQQTPAGSIGPHAYEAGVTLMTLVEAYERSGKADAKIKDAIQKAIHYAAKTQKTAGGWDYKPSGLFNNTGTSSWWIQGLTAARKNGFDVPEDTLLKARFYFEKATAEDGSCSYAGRYKSVSDIKTGGGTPFLSAIAASSLRELDSDQEKKIAAARRRMMRWMPEKDNRDFYFAAWQVWSLRHDKSSNEWRRLKKTIGPIVTDTQISLGATKDIKGSWDPGADRYGGQWGRVGQTALGAIMLSLLE